MKAGKQIRSNKKRGQLAHNFGNSHTFPRPDLGASLLAMQSTIGNRAVNKFLQGGISPGVPLDSAILEKMENNLGESFSTVRINTDSAANKSAESISAKAYTYGENVIFKRGQYNPNTSSGEDLLIHELSHVVDQRQNHSQKPVIQRAPDDKKTSGDPEKELGEKLVSEFPFGVAIAFYADGLAEAERRAIDWAKEQNSVGLKGSKVKADQIVLGKPISDTLTLDKTLTAIGGVLSAAVAKASGSAVLDPSKMLASKIKTLAIFSHGTSNWCGLGGGITSSNATATVKSIAPVVTPDLKVLLYSCSGARGPSEDESWMKGTLEAGGTGSLASKLRDAMVEQGISQGEVWGHTTVGHVSQNFALRFFTAMSGKGQEGFAYAGFYVWGLMERINFLFQLQGMVEEKGYPIDDKNSKKFFSNALGLLNNLLYLCYADANRELNYKGKNLAEAAPLYPREVAALIREHWEKKYWIPAKKEELAAKAIKAAGLKKYEKK